VSNWFHDAFLAPQTGMQPAFHPLSYLEKDLPTDGTIENAKKFSIDIMSPEHSHIISLPDGCHAGAAFMRIVGAGQHFLGEPRVIDPQQVVVEEQMERLYPMRLVVIY
jgi:hypothetical protein